MQQITGHIYTIYTRWATGKRQLPNQSATNPCENEVAMGSCASRRYSVTDSAESYIDISTEGHCWRCKLSHGQCSKHRVDTLAIFSPPPSPFYAPPISAAATFPLHKHGDSAASQSPPSSPSPAYVHRQPARVPRPLPMPALKETDGGTGFYYKRSRLEGDTCTSPVKSVSVAPAAEHQDRI